jgi:segregation and condensation protein A
MAFLPAGPGDERVRRSTLAAHLAASLELTRAGMIEVSQASAFGPIYLRRRR